MLLIFLPFMSINKKISKILSLIGLNKGEYNTSGITILRSLNK
jgi:hypothetical protein